MAVQAMVLAGFSAKSIAKQLDFQLTLNHRELNRGKADETSLASGSLFHQIDRRVEGHPFISVLAYHFVHTLRLQLNAQGNDDS